MQSPTRSTTSTSALPAVLAEYGRLAARLPSATASEAEELRRRLAELDVVIDDEVAASEARPD